MTELRKILHVEDEPDIREVARLALETVGGFVVESCASGEDAVVRAPAFRPDLVLLDVMMPGLDGPATFQRLRQIPGFEKIPVIFMTAKAMPQEIERFRELGALDVITKPFDPMELASQIRAIWARAHG